MTDKLIKQIKADREAGTPGPWVVGAKNGGTAERSVDSHHHSICFCHHHCVGAIEKEMEANARRIARVPDMEARILADAKVIEAAKELANIVECYGVYTNMELAKVHTALAAFNEALKGEE